MTGIGVPGGALEGAGRGICCCGAGGGVDGIVCLVGRFVFGEPSSTLVPNPAFFVARIERESDVTMNRIADTVVAFESNVAEPRGPKAVCDPIPPNAPAKSADGKEIVGSPALMLGTREVALASRVGLPSWQPRSE